jgi:2-amino-4-hydroxy-6-hydroxymethyldihydropteridine diphosphokinase
LKQDDQPDEKYSLALVCAGSNVTSIWGNPHETVLESAKQLSVVFDTRISSSKLYTTPAFPAGSGPDFVNAAFAFETDKIGEEVLELLHDIEARAKRIRETRWAARTLDLDLIGMGDQILPNLETCQHWMDLPLSEQQKNAPEQLILPHPRLQDRAFALVPLTDVAPKWVHPIIGLDIRQLKEAIPSDLLEEVKPLS